MFHYSKVKYFSPLSIPCQMISIVPLGMLFSTISAEIGARSIVLGVALPCRRKISLSPSCRIAQILSVFIIVSPLLIHIVQCFTKFIICLSPLINATSNDRSRFSIFDIIPIILQNFSQPPIIILHMTLINVGSKGIDR